MVDLALAYLGRSILALFGLDKSCGEYACVQHAVYSTEPVLIHKVEDQGDDIPTVMSARRVLGLPGNVQCTVWHVQWLARPQLIRTAEDRALTSFL